MTATKLQEAINCIKSGDRQTGQRLLTEVLHAEPGNEAAWLWMSALMSGEKRRFCLEKVLSLNPNHPQAREQLAKLATSSPQTVATVAPEFAASAPKVPAPPPIQAAVPAIAAEPPAPSPSPSSLVTMQSASLVPEPARSSLPVQELKPQVWFVPGKTTTGVIYLSRDVLLTFDVFPDKVPAALGEIGQGITAKQLDQLKKKYSLFSLKYAPLAKITSVTALGDTVKVIWTDNSGNEKKVACSTDKEISQGILNALRERLPGFQESASPISRLRVTMSSFGFLAFTCVATSFFWWLVRGAQEELRAGGNVRIRGIVALLMLIGPNGILCIGGALTVIGIIATILSLSKPPIETVLARGTGLETNR